MKKTLVLGASTNPSRYAYLAAHALKKNDHEIIPVGIKEGEVAGEKIVNSKEIQSDIHTVTLYIGSARQAEWYDYILESNPKRLIFNPGTENSELEEKAKAKGIETLQACTLVMLSTNQY